MYDYRISGVDDTVTLTVIRPSASTKRPRDFQRSKVYSWERAVFGRPTEKLTLEQCAELANKICGFKVTVKDGRGRRKAYAYYETRTIALPKWARCEWVVIHECAHLLTDREHASHGAHYMKNYIRLLDQSYAFALLPSGRAAHLPVHIGEQGLTECARRFGLKVAE
jgi:hypothetical protein